MEGKTKRSLYQTQKLRPTPRPMVQFLYGRYNKPRTNSVILEEKLWLSEGKWIEESESDKDITRQMDGKKTFGGDYKVAYTGNEL